MSKITTTLLTAAAIATLAFTAIAPAEARMSLNAQFQNGISHQGVEMNAQFQNGVSHQGAAENGASVGAVRGYTIVEITVPEKVGGLRQPADADPRGPEMQGVIIEE